MMARFADTFYYLALLNPQDAWHKRVTAMAETLKGSLVTTAWVLTEVADALSAPEHRAGLVEFLDSLRLDPESLVIPASQDLFEQGIELYRARLDKDWPLTDCISFVVMREHEIADALTGDHHFAQAGFRILLR
jgi:uncharacterized protein